MRDVTIYDSQGTPLGGGPGGVDERIKDFFFDGVRLAISRVRGQFEVVCFFRARDTEDSRSEQYYAVLKAGSLREFTDLQSEVERHVEEEHDKIVDTSSEDVQIFQVFGDEPGRAPGSNSTRQDIVDLVEQGNRATLGVGSYRDAYALLRELIPEVKTRDVAISENASSSRLSDYTIAIEKGDYNGIELLGDTGDQIEAMKKRRQRLSGPAGDPYGNQSSGIPIEAIVALAGAGILLLFIFGSYGACVFAGAELPLVGSPPGVSCGPNASIAVDDHDLTEDSFTVAGSLSENGEKYTRDNSTAMNFTVYTNDTRAERVEEVVTLQNGSFDTVVEFDGSNWTASEVRNITLEWRDDSKSVEFNATDETPTPTEESNQTGTSAGSTDTPNSTSTDTPNGTSTDTPNGTSTDTPNGTSTDTPNGTPADTSTAETSSPSENTSSLSAGTALDTQATGLKTPLSAPAVGP